MDEEHSLTVQPDLADDNENEIKGTAEAAEKLLNAKDEKHDLDRKLQAPVDRFYIVYIIFIIHGIGVLMPWNMFITANDYFVNYKLAETKPSVNGTSEGEAVKTVYQIYFLGFLGFVAQIPTVILNGVNAFSHGLGGSTSRRIVWSIIIVVIMFAFTIVLAMIDSSEWPPTFFWLTMASVVIINMANGIYQNSIFGTAACLPMKYPNAVIVGSNVSGTLTSIIMIMSKAGAPDVRTSAIFYFLTAIFVLLAAFDTFYILEFLPFYLHYSRKTEANLSSQTNVNRSRPPYWEIFKKTWVHDISAFLVFFVTLSVFPAIQANVRPSDQNFFIPDDYFSAVTCFLLFNVFALTGNIVSNFIQKPGPKWAWLPVALRLLFIPFFVLCNVNPETRQLPVVIRNDYVYVIGAILMAFTSGYFSSLAMMYAPSPLKESKHQEVAGMLAAFFIVLGIFCGVTFSIPLTMLIENVGGGSGAEVMDALNGISNFTTTTIQ